jgi:hypothetical protein
MSAELNKIIKARFVEIGFPADDLLPTEADFVHMLQSINAGGLLIVDRRKKNKPRYGVRNVWPGWLQDYAARRGIKT